MNCANGGRREDGATLIELIIAVAILGIAVVVIVGSMGTSIAASDRHRTEADVAAMLVSATEQVKAAASPHVACASTASYLSAAQGVSVPSGWVTRGWTAANAVTIPSVYYWDGARFERADGSTTSGSTTFVAGAAAFTPPDATADNDKGRPIVGTNIPPGTTIASVSNNTTVQLSNAATGTGSGLTFSVCRESGADRVPLALQLVTIQISSPDGRATQRVSVVKSA